MDKAEGKLPKLKAGTKDTTDSFGIKAEKILQALSVEEHLRVEINDFITTQKEYIGKRRPGRFSQSKKGWGHDNSDSHRQGIARQLSGFTTIYTIVTEMRFKSPVIGVMGAGGDDIMVELGNLISRKGPRCGYVFVFAARLCCVSVSPFV